MTLTREDIIRELESPLPEENAVQAIQQRLYNCNIYSDSFPEACEKGLELVLSRSIQMNYPDGEMQARFLLVHFLFEKGEPARAREYFDRAMYLHGHADISVQSKMMGSNSIAYMHWFQGEYAKAFDIAISMLKQAHEIEDPVSEGWLYYGLGVFNYDLKDYATSREYYTKALNKFLNEDRGAYGAARSKTGIAGILIQEENYEEAQTLLLDALNVYRDLSVSAGTSRVLHDLATIEVNRKNFEAALAFEKESLKIREETQHLQAKITSLTELGNIYLQLDNVPEAESSLRAATELATAMQSKAKLFRCYFLLSQLYKKLRDPWKALEYYENYHSLKEQVLGETSNNQIKRLQNQFEKEKSEREAEIERLRNVELKQANEIISAKNKEILDSINYARRIQEALITNEKYIDRALKRLNKK